MCEVLGESLKGSKVRTDKGLKVELQRLAQVLGEGPQVVAAPTAEGPPRAEILANRMATLESGRQPSYGKRQQLIPDGLNSVREHLERAMRLDHPFNTTESLKADHHEALSAQILSEKDMNELRLESPSGLAATQQMSLHFGAAAEPRSNGGKQRQASWEEASHNPYGDPGRKIQDRGQCSPKTVSHRDAHSGQGVGVPLLRRLRCAAGNQAAGAALISAIQKADCAEESGIYGKTGREQQAQAIFTKTIKEVAQGTMGGPYTHTELVQRHGPHYNVIPSFGLEQGVDESNKPKFRRIDDHTAGFTNLAAHRRQKIAMSMADYLVVMIKAMYNTSRCSLTVGTEDMKQAYRQIPLLDSQTSLAVTAIYNPHTQQPELYEIYGQPFGAGHSVPNFYRTLTG